MMNDVIEMTHLDAGNDLYSINFLCLQRREIRASDCSD